MKFLKHILFLPNPTADPVVYILTGTIAIEGLIHKRALSLFGNVCRSGDSATEWQLAKQQLTMTTFNSKSWFFAIKKILIKYGLPGPVELLCNPPKKFSSFNHNKVDPTCMLCRNGEETLQYFLLGCSALSQIRNPIIDNILGACRGLCNPAYVAEQNRTEQNRNFINTQVYTDI